VERLAGDHVPSIAIAIASFNRRAVTLGCLARIEAQTARGSAFETQVFLLDDASSDGTAEAVALAFPQVTLCRGTGTLFWGGGMHRAMAAAIRRDPDFILLLNDDVSLAPDAIGQALAAHDEARARNGSDLQVIVGATTDPVTDLCSYSGFRRTRRRDPSKVERVPPDPGGLTPCDTMNGNFVLIPRAVFAALGPIDEVFVHQLGDLDYGYRASALGARIWIAPRPVGTCPVNDRVPAFRRKGLTPLQRFRALNSPLGLPLKPWATFMWRWGGPFAIMVLIGIYLKRMAGR
jgi:GT2 family glycosyltransferase